MKRFWPKFALILLSVASAFSQDTKPAPTPTPSTDNEVVKISTNLIQIDVSVTDSKGKAVTDLKPEEVEIYENGQRQKITNFSFVSSGRTVRESKKSEADKIAVAVPAVPLRPEQVRRTLALVVDDLSLSFESAHFTRRTLKRFVDEQMQDGDLVAIIRTSGGVGALQQFTSDKRILYAAIEKVKWNVMGTGGQTAFAPIAPSTAALMKSLGDKTISDKDVANDANFNNAFGDFSGSFFVTGTLGALKYVLTGMNELPGRKSVILFSDGFRILERDRDGDPQTGRVLDSLRQLVELANRSSVIFYTIDPRGLQYIGITAADKFVDNRSTSVNAKISERRDQLQSTQAGLNYLAQETGGFSIQNNNDLSGGVLRVLEDQSYYLVAYEPDPGSFDPVRLKFNKLEVKVSRKDALTRYRSGFYNVTSDAVAKKPAAKTPEQQLEAALLSPFAAIGIKLRLNALFGNDIVSGSYVTSLLHVDARELKLADQSDGTKRAEFEVLAISFGANGLPIDHFANAYALNIPPDQVAKFKSEGFVYHFNFPVKKPGAFQYRVVIRDTQGGKIGSANQFIEVPNLKKNRLTLSSLLLESLSADEWKALADPNGGAVPTDPVGDTALRRFRRGKVLRYGYDIYNAKLDMSKRVSLHAKMRLFCDGKLVFESQPQPIDLTGQTQMGHIRSSRGLFLGTEMPLGDYILQVVVTDDLAAGNEHTATQLVQFEVIE